MSSSSFDYITCLIPDATAQQSRIQDLVIELEDMEKSLSVADFGVYFNKVMEMKDLLLEELVTVCSTLQRQESELERLSITVKEKNKAITTLARENDKEKEELKSAQNELRQFRERVAEMEKRQSYYEFMLTRLKKTDSAREEDLDDLDVVDADSEII